MAAAAAAGDGGGGATIARLSKEAVSAIRSGISVPSLAQAVEELVANAIDAKARTVTCRINLSNFSVQVDDDGSGIKEQDLPLIGKRYHTSKCQQLHDLNSKVTSYGFRGEALASLRDVGALNIITRTAEAHSVTRQCKLDAKTAAVGMAATQRATAGTTIIISDLFKTSPVRRKCITSGDIEEARRRVETIALAHTNVAFALYNAATGQQLLRVARADSAASTFEQIFGTDKSAHLVPVTRTVGPITVSGHVSVGSHHNRHLQFLYINKRHVYATKFHKLINQLLPLPLDNPDAAKATSPRTSRRCAVFVINIVCPPSSYDICFEPQKTWIEFGDWDSVLSTFRAALDTVIPASSTGTGGGRRLSSPTRANASAAGNAAPIASVFLRAAAQGGGRRGSGGTQSIVTPRSTRRISLTPNGRHGSNSTNGQGSGKTVQFAAAAGAFVANNAAAAVAEEEGGDADGEGAAQRHDDDDDEAPQETDEEEEQAGAAGYNSSPSSTPAESLDRPAPTSPKLKALSQFQYEAPQRGGVVGTARRAPPSAAVSMPTAQQFGAGTLALAVASTPSVRTPPTRPASFTSSFSANSARKRRRITSSTGRSSSSSSSSSSGGGSVGTPFRMACRAGNAMFGSCGGSCCISGGSTASFVSPTARISLPRQSTNASQPHSRRDDADGGAGAGGYLPSPAAVANPMSITDLEQEEIDSILSTFPVSDADLNQDDKEMEVEVEAEDARIATALSAGNASDGDDDSADRSIAASSSVPHSPAHDAAAAAADGDFESDPDVAGLDRIKWRVPLPEAPTFPPPEKQDAGPADAADAIDVDGGSAARNAGEAPLVQTTTLTAWLAEGAHTITPYGPGIIRPASVLPRRLTKDMLCRLQVINQVDCKFIVCKLGSAIADGLYIVDQHAAHERVRLEDLTARLCIPKPGEMAGYAGIYGARILQAAVREPPLPLQLGESDIGLLLRFKGRMAQLGLEFRQYGSTTAGSGGSARPSASAVHAVKVPAPMARSASATVANFVKVQLGILEQTSGAALAAGVIPPPILDVLNLRACHGAIKFGDELSHDECTRLLAELSKCNTPFQCAHGRPTVLPLSAFGS